MKTDNKEMKMELRGEKEVVLTPQDGLVTQSRPDFFYRLAPGRGILAEVERGLKKGDEGLLATHKELDILGGVSILDQDWCTSTGHLGHHQGADVLEPSHHR